MLVTKHKIIDNFLPDEIFNKLEFIIFESKHFPWYFQADINTHHNKQLKSDDKTWYMTHIIYHNINAQSSYFNDFKVILNELDVKALIRMKVNFYPSTEKLDIHKKHVDYSFPHKGFILYFNSCDGYTILEDGTKIESIRNRALLFDSSSPHRSTSCTNTKGRFNININYL